MAKNGNATLLKESRTMKKLPKRVKINLADILDNNIYDEVWEEVMNYLSEKYGYCFNGCDVKSFDIVLDNIDWDEEE